MASTRSRTYIRLFNAFIAPPRSCYFRSAIRSTMHTTTRDSVKFRQSQYSPPESPSQRSTIYALATPPGRGGIGVVRVSGAGANGVWKHMLVAHKRGTSIPLPEKDSLRRLSRCRIVHPVTKEIIDDGMAVYFHAPNSYTSEDVVELHIHSGRAVIAAVLSSLADLSQGAFRLAEPGEFTRRAFESGRIDLTEAEGIRDLIDAETESQRKLAIRAAEGAVKQRFESLRTGVIKVLASIEAIIDFGEGEEIEESVFEQAHQNARSLRGQILTHLSDNRRGEILRSGIRLAIFGPPNAGKSSLLNYLAQRQAAIVTPLPGTTRDVLEVSLDIGGMPVIVCDTAGIRESDDIVETIGVERASEVVKSADISLCILSLPELIHPPQSLLHSHPYFIPDDVVQYITPDSLVFLNKNDLISRSVDERHVTTTWKRVLGLTEHVWVGSVLKSDKGGMDGFMEGLIHALKRRTALAEGQTGDAVPLITRARHREHLERSLLHIEAFLSLESPTSVVTGAEELRYAAREIGKISAGGTIDVEDVLDSIFRDFCIGK